MAAAYLFHIVQNHPFVDGNKRTGLICCLAFLELNGVETHTEPRLYDLTMDVASGIVTKADIAAMLASMFPSKP
jgi:death on curing protein